MSQDLPPSSLTGEVRVRLPLPVIIPLGALLLIGALAIGFSRVLLSIPAEAATIVASAMAINILGACAVIALRPRMNRGTWAELAIVVLYPVIIGVVLSQVSFGSEEAAHHAPQPPPGGGGPTTEITAEGIAFDTSTITLAAGEETTLEFVNDDSVQHNLAIFDGSDASGEKLFEGELIGNGSTTYEIPPLDEGEYHFHCDIHPGMNGTVVVE